MLHGSICGSDIQLCVAAVISTLQFGGTLSYTLSTCCSAKIGMPLVMVWVPPGKRFPAEALL